MTIREAEEFYKNHECSYREKWRALMDAMIKAGIKFTIETDGTVTINDERLR